MLQEFELKSLGTLRIHVLPLSNNYDLTQTSLENNKSHFDMHYHMNIKDIIIMGYMFRINILTFLGIQETIKISRLSIHPDYQYIQIINISRLSIYPDQQYNYPDNQYFQSINISRLSIYPVETIKLKALFIGWDIIMNSIM